MSFYFAMNKTELSVDSVWEVALKVVIFNTLLNCWSPDIVLMIDSVVNKNIYNFFLKRSKTHVFTGYW